MNLAMHTKSAGHTKSTGAGLLAVPGGRRYAVALVVDALGSGLLRPFLLLYAIGVLRLGVGTAGLALSAGMLAGLPAVTPLGRWLDRGARSTAVVVTLLTRAAGVGVLLAADGTAGFTVAATLLGTGTQTWPATHAAMVATLTQGRARDAALAASRSLRNAGLGAGALLATLALAGGAGTLRGLAVVTAVGYLAAALLVRSMRVTAPAAGTGAPRQDRRTQPALKAITVLSLANLPFALCFDVLEIALPVLLVTHLHASPAWSSAIFVGNTVLVIAAQVAVVRGTANRPRRTVLAGSGVLLAASYAGFWAAGGLGGQAGATAIASVAVLYTFGEILYAGSGTALIVSEAPPQLLGRALARWQLSMGVGRAAAPTVLTALLTAGAGALWATLAASTLVGAAVVLRTGAGSAREAV
jgi:dipeptide/tripeptide permease